MKTSQLTNFQMLCKKRSFDSAVIGWSAVTAECLQVNTRGSILCGQVLTLQLITSVVNIGKAVMIL